MAEQKKSGIVMARSKSNAKTPPGIFGFSSLVKPDEYEGKKKFKTNLHLNEAGVEALAEVLQRHCVDALWPKFLEECEKAGKSSAKFVKPDMREFVEDKLKDPKPGGKMDLPYIQFSNKAEYRDKKSGETVMKHMNAWSAQGAPLDLPGIKLGMGSVVQVVFAPGLFINPLIKNPTPSLQLQGVMVHKLVQFGGGGAQTMEAASDDEIAGIMGTEFESEDLSAFVGGMNSGDKPKASERQSFKRSSLGNAGFGEDLDDEIPF